MSSATSTDPRPDALQPWQLFVLAGLIGATVVVFLSRGLSAAGIVVLSCAIFAAAFVGLAALRMLLPLTGSPAGIETEVLGGRTRAALEREKALALRSIKELEFDHGMGKISEKDFAEMSARLRGRAMRIMRQLDEGADYRAQIERELAQRVGSDAEPTDAGPTTHAHVNACLSCQTANDPDARFCKECGTKLGPPA